MQISHKAEYAVRAILDLALHAAPDRGERSADIARRTGVPEKFLQAILLDLRKSGFVISKRGPSGGNWLALSPARITVGAVVQAIDRAREPAPAVPGNSAAPAEICLCALWRRVEASVHAALDGVTLEELLASMGAQGAYDFSI